MANPDQDVSSHQQTGHNPTLPATRPGRGGRESHSPSCRASAGSHSALPPCEAACPLQDSAPESMLISDPHCSSPGAQPAAWEWNGPSMCVPKPPGSLSLERQMGGWGESWGQDNPALFLTVCPPISQGMPLSGLRHCHPPLSDSVGGGHTLTLPPFPGPGEFSQVLPGQGYGQAGTGQEVSKSLGTRHLLVCWFLI